MPRVSPARETAFRILRRVESGQEFAVDLLQAPQVSRLQEVDRRLTTELVMGVLRAKGELDHWIAQLSGKRIEYFDPEVATVLRLGIYQIRFLAKIPKSAAVNEAVELTKAIRKRSAAGLVNAVLRKCGKPGAASKLGEGGALRALPAWLEERWERNFGNEAMKCLAASSLKVPPTSLRVSTAYDREEIRQELAQEGVVTRLGRFSKDALVVESGNVQASRAFQEGRIVIQDEASQLVGQLVAPRQDDRVLDLCAAPGIKTRQLAEALGRGMLVACDVSNRRVGTLRRLLQRSFAGGLPVHILRLDAAQVLPFGVRFERILVDAPCSGTGTLARNPEIKWRLDSHDLGRLAEVQEKILHNALRVLAPGGRLVYATCSLEPEENENVVRKVLGDCEGFRLLTGAELSNEFCGFAGLFDSRGYLKTRPDLHSTDGFFGAVIEGRR